MLKVISILGLVVMIGALVGLHKIGVLFTAQPIAIALQLTAIALMGKRHGAIYESLGQAPTARHMKAQGKREARRPGLPRVREIKA